VPRLREIATAGVTPEGRRLTAIRSIGRLPGGAAVLADLQQQPDAIGGFATRELQRLRGTDPSLPSAAAVLLGLGSNDVVVRSRAIQDLGRIPAVPNVLQAIVPLLETGATTNTGERVSLLQYLAALDTAESAEAAAAVARDRRQPEAARNAAILALTGMSSSTSSMLLRQLATDLEDGAPRRVAELVAD
jgi:hypothetical protein